jgi:threonylcarbamoyladenosine tRNA methylthiotransferase MtaB
MAPNDEEGAAPMKVHLRTLGCRLNQAEIDHMARQFQQQGHEITTDSTQAEWVVVNTCAVTQDATRSSRHLVRELHRANPAAQISVTGCYAQIAPQDIQVLPGVARVVNNLEKDRLVEAITGQPLEVYDREPLDRTAKAGAYGRTRAFLKVQDGCENACTFCITTIARGEGRSRPLAEIIHEVQELHAIGYQEVVLTGVHLGSYGHDLGQLQGLSQLIRALLLETDIPRIRVSSLEPWDLTPDFFDLWADSRLCRHLHLPLQSGCDATLKRMLRRTTQAQFRALMQAARERIPGVNITSDVIVGFPAETHAEFSISESFIHEMDFAGLHVFRYSKRPGTAAARMKGYIPEDLKKHRSARLITWAQAAEVRFAQHFIGQQLPVLWEHISAATADGFMNVGYTDNYIRVACIHPRVLTDTLTPAVLERFDQQQIIARPVLDPIGV